MALDVASQGELGVLLGSSKSTGQRWERREAFPLPEQLHQLAALVFPRDAQLAAEIAAASGSTLEKLGVTPTAAAAAPDQIHIVDTVVCAAAEAMQVVPDAIRPALRAAFRRARQAQLSLETIDEALNRPSVPAEGARPPGAAARAGAAKTTKK